MALVGADFPDRLAAEGLSVQVFSDWYTHGGSADHGAVVLHHTASGSSTRPEDDAAYCHHGSGDAPLYNVLVDRYGVVWLLARDKSNSSGSISSVALIEALHGKANSTSAVQRGLGDDTSNNAALFAVACQNNGVGEAWSSALIDATSITAAVALESLGLSHAGYLTQHRVLTARKVDCCGGNCPYDWQQLVQAALSGDRGKDDDVPSGAQMMATTPDGDGYWIVASDGGVFAYGSAGFYGSLGGVTLNAPVVGITACPDGRGYWLLGQDGGVFAYGSAQFYGAPTGHVQ